MKKILITVLLLAAFVLSGCAEKSGSASTAATPVPTQKSTMETITIYSIDSDSMSLIPVVLKKQKKKATAEYIGSLVLENLDDEDVAIDRIQQDKNKVIVSFSDKGKPIKNCSKKMENLILNCIACSLLDNVPNCDEVIYRCGDRAYKSEHRSFGKNEVYASD